MIRLFVERKITTAMIFLAICLLGIISFYKLPVDLLPDIEMPVLTVITPFSGASPSEVDRLVTSGIEEAVSATGGVAGIESESIEGMSIVRVNFQWGTDMDMALIETKEKVDLIKGQLPEYAGKSVVVKYDPSAEPVMIYSIIMNRRDSINLRRRVEREIVPRIERIRGVALAEVLGGEKREIAVNVDNSRLRSRNLSIDEVVRSIELANYSYPAGSITGREKEYLVRTSGEFRNLKDIRSVVAGYNENGVPVYLSDLALVEDALKDKKSVIRFNGSEAVALLVKKEPDKNTIETCGLIAFEMDALQKRLKDDFIFNKIYDQSEFIKDSISSVFLAAVMGGIMAFFVLWFFLKSLLPPVIVALAIPVSVAGTFILMNFSGISLNSISLGGLAVGIGMMVDSGIVVLESICGRKKEGNYDKTEAAISGVRDVAAPVTSSILTTIIVFVPVVFLSGMAGAVFSDLSLTVSFALLFSLATSLTLVPMLACYGSSATFFFMPDSTVKFQKGIFAVSDKLVKRLIDAYEKIIVYSLARSRMVIMTGASVFFAGIFIMAVPEREIMPSVDPGEFVVEIEMPGGTPIEETSSFSKSIEEFISTIPGVEHVFAKAGSDPDDNIAERISGRGGDYAEVRVFLKKSSRLSSERAISKVRNGFTPGEEVKLTYRIRDDITSYLFNSGGDSVEVEIYGGEGRELDYAGSRVMDILRGYPGLENILSLFQRNAPELIVDIDRRKAAALGLCIESTAFTVGMSVKGDISTRFKDEDDEIDVRVRLQKKDRSDVLSLSRIMIKNENGMPIALSEFAEIRQGRGADRIVRKEQNRVNIISAGFSSGSGVDRENMKTDLASLNFREGIEVNLADNNEVIRETLSPLLSSMVLAVIFIYMLLASRFQSLKNPLIIMLSIPLTVPGVFLSLAATGQSVNINSVIGMIMLCGIVVNNAIVLFDFIEKGRQAGSSVRIAVIEAGKKRLRPILMTTLTTVFALLPVALGVGRGSGLQQPLAVTVIGGLIFSTALTLVFMPVVYEALNRTGEARE